jgi:hypothetical protein
MHILDAHHLALTTSRFEVPRAFYVKKLGLPVVGGFPGRDHRSVTDRHGS